MEFDRVLGENTCNNFRQTWLDLVPFIIAAARKCKQKNVDTLLKTTRYENITDFGIQVNILS